MTPLRLATAALILLLAAPAVLRADLARLEAVRGYGPDLVAYATVERPDGSYRRMLTQPETLAALAETGETPEGARILMETHYSPGQVSTVFHMEKAGGAWRFGSFNGAPDLSTRPQASCLACHARAAETDFLYTLPSLEAAARGFGPSRHGCDRGGRSPCALTVYAEGAARP